MNRPTTDVEERFSLQALAWAPRKKTFWLLIALAIVLLSRHSSNTDLDEAVRSPPTCVYTAHGDVAGCNVAGDRVEEIEE